jgi:hypothetical protein
VLGQLSHRGVCFLRSYATKNLFWSPAVCPACTNGHAKNSHVQKQLSVLLGRRDPAYPEAPMAFWPRENLALQGPNVLLVQVMYWRTVPRASTFVVAQ